MSITSFGPVDQRSYQQLVRCVQAGESLEAGADVPGVLCADHHPGYSMPIGGVVGYRHHISPNGVGYDIACGNMAAQTPLKVSEVDIPGVMQEIAKSISFGVGRRNTERIDSPVFDQIDASPVEGQRRLLTLAREQLGTVGGGNHYVDLFEDEGGRLWIGVHFGSRGFGHKTANGFLALGQGRQFEERAPEGPMDSPPLLLDTRAPLGQDYIEAMTIAGNYAYAGREWVVSKVLDILKTHAISTVHNHHNFAWREEHSQLGGPFWVIRKGATPAFPGQMGFVGGSMGDDAVILEGVEALAAAKALYSTVHGAGRVMSRREAAGKSRWHRGRRVMMTRGRVNWPEWQARLKQSGIALVGGGPDEAPEVYKRLDEVLAHHADSVRILHRLRPVGVAMAGDESFDPYKD